MKRCLLAFCLLIPAAMAVPRALFPRWRGNNVASHALTPELIELLAGWNCNALRVQIEVDGRALPIERQRAPSLRDPLGPYRGNLARLDAILPLCRAKGIQVILCASDVYGIRTGRFWQPVRGRIYRDDLIAFWGAIARRYHDEPAIVAYDVKNEPVYRPAEAAIWWTDLLPRSIQAIRAGDQTAWLVIEPGPSAFPWGFKGMPEAPDARVIYSFHHYMPQAYVLQGVRFLQHRGPDTRGLYAYPGYAPRFDGGQPLWWDKRALEASMTDVVRFQAAHPGARIYVGEFGVVRWAPGAARWLSDSIEIIERHGWDWTFHCVGDWNGFDPTYAADDPPHNRAVLAEGKDTDRLEAVKRGWALNRRSRQAH